MNFINNIKNFINKNWDKLLHFVIGYAITLSLSSFVPSWVALLFGISIGGLKEFLDSKLGGDPDWKDFVVTAAGSICGCLWYLL